MNSLSEFTWLFAAVVLLVAILSWIGANASTGVDVERLLATTNRLVLELRWLVAGTLFSFGLWPMFFV